MRTTAILKDETPNRCLKRLVALKHVKRFLAASVVAMLAFGATLSADARYLIEPRIIIDKTIYLLAAPLTPEERQIIHAGNFNQLPLSARAVYLHAVAYAMSFAAASNGELPTSAMLAQHLEDVCSWNGEQGTMAIYIAPAIPPEYSQLLAAHMAVVETELQEINVQISGQVANNTSYQQAMYAGGVYGFAYMKLGD